MCLNIIDVAASNVICVVTELTLILQAILFVGGNAKRLFIAVCYIAI